MYVSELKEILKSIPDNATVVISNADWERLKIVGHQFVDKSLADDNNPVLFIDVKKDAPHYDDDEYYDDDDEYYDVI